MQGKHTKGKSRNVVQILDASIKNIEDGLWICNELTRCDVDDPKRVMGCALGLVGINAGEATLSLATVPVYDDEGYATGENQQVVMANLLYPSEGEWRKAARDAIDYLAQTTRYSKQEARRVAEQHFSDDSGELTLEQKSAIVVAYNDGGRGGRLLSPKTALSWFTRARDMAAADAKTAAKRRKRKHK